MSLRRFSTTAGNARAEQETIGAFRAARGRPTAPVTMYRAVPPGVSSINTGDWVTPSRSYARVISARTQAQHLHSPGDYIHEFGYAGAPLPARSLGRR